MCRRTTCKETLHETSCTGPLARCLHPGVPGAAAARPAAAHRRLLFARTAAARRRWSGRLDAAKTSILVQAYSFTSAPIAKALVEAHKRGVRVEVILDKSQTERRSTATADFLREHGHPDPDRRQARHRPQQGHGHRRPRWSSPAASTSPSRPRRATPRTCWSSATRPWPSSIRPTGGSTPRTPSLTRGKEAARGRREGR